MNHSRYNPNNHLESKPVAYSFWHNASRDQKTTIYFEHAGKSRVSQSRWWNNVDAAFQWFEENLVKN